MAPMPIHTAPVDKIKYVRLLGSDITAYRKSHRGAVGIVQGYAGLENLVFVKSLGEDCVVNIEDVEYITKKEYFKGILSGRQTT